MTSSGESFIDFKEDLLDNLDVLRLEPVTIKRVLIIAISMFIPAIAIIVFYIIYPIAWIAILLIIAAGLLILGVYLLYFDYKRISKDKKIYIFSRNGITIEKEGKTDFVSWDDIEDLKIKGRYRSQKTPRKCIIKTKNEEIIIQVNNFNEVTSDIKHPDTILREILKFYERIKKK